MSFVEDIVGLEDLILRAMFEDLLFVEEKKNLFAKFPIGATIQDDGKRKKSRCSFLFYFSFLFSFLFYLFSYF